MKKIFFIIIGFMFAGIVNAQQYERVVLDSGSVWKVELFPQMAIRSEK